MSKSMTGCFTCFTDFNPNVIHMFLTDKFDLTNVNNMVFYISGTKTFIRDNRNFDSSEFDSTGVKLYIFIHNEVRDFDKNLTQPEIRDNESQLYLV